MLMATTNIFAETFTLNGLNYLTTSSGTVKIISVENKDELFSVIIPSTVTYNSKNYRVTKIDNNVFDQCPVLSSVTFDKESNLEQIGEYVFHSCLLLTEINIPKSVTLIGKYAFRGCANLSSVIFEKESKLETIGEAAFHNCTSLSEIIIPKSVTLIGPYAFNISVNLSSVTFEGIACQNAISLDAFTKVGTKEKPATLILPDDWENEKLPIDNKTPWHGGYFNSNRYLIPIDQLKSDAKNDIDAAMGEYKSNKYLLSIIADELNAIDNATSKATIDTNKEAAIAKITAALTAFQVVKASALGTLGTPQNGPALIVTDKDDNEIILYAPKSVEYIKVNEE